MFRELCGDSTLKNVVLTTNMWGEVSKDVGEAREKGLATTFFKPVLDKGAQLARHHNTAQSARDIIRRIMKNRPLALQIQRELVDEHKDIINTAAGETINKETNELIRLHQAELKALQDKMMKALKEKDEAMKRQMEQETRKLQDQVNKMKKDSQSMTSSYQEEKKKMQETMKQMEVKARQERERAEVAHKKQMDILNKRLKDSANSSAAERKAIQQRVDKLQKQWDERPRGGCLIM